METEEITPNANTKKIKHRFVTCLQSSGRIGKSTVMEGIMTWADFAGVPFAAVDCDAEHRTLSERFPDATFVDATRSNDEFLRLINEMPDIPLALADFPARRPASSSMRWNRSRSSTCSRNGKPA